MRKQRLQELAGLTEAVSRDDDNILTDGKEYLKYLEDAIKDLKKIEKLYLKAISTIKSTSDYIKNVDAYRPIDDMVSDFKEEMRDVHTEVFGN